MCYSSITVLLSIVLFLLPKTFWLMALTWGLVIYAWFAFSVIMLIQFWVKKIERVALWIPGLYVVDMFFSTLIGAFAVKDATSLDQFAEIQKDPVITVLGMIFPVIILILSAKLYLRK